MQKAVICTCGQDAINLLCEVREDLRGRCLVLKGGKKSLEPSVGKVFHQKVEEIEVSWGRS